jgi:hypothetical protein
MALKYKKVENTAPQFFHHRFKFQTPGLVLPLFEEYYYYYYFVYLHLQNSIAR